MAWLIDKIHYWWNHPCRRLILREHITMKGPYPRALCPRCRHRNFTYEYPTK